MPLGKKVYNLPDKFQFSCTNNPKTTNKRVNMGKNLLIDRIEDSKEFTTSEQFIATYICRNKEQIAKLSIGDLASETHTSNPTIIRFCQKLGFDGYSDFKISFVSELERYYYRIKSIDSNIPFVQPSNFQEISKRICELNKEVVNSCYLSFSNDLLKNVTNVLRNTNRIFMYAFGDSFIRALSFKNKLIKINKYAIIITEHSEEAYHLCNITPDDCVLYISFSGGLYKAYEKHAQIYKQRGIQQIVITSKADCPIAKICDIVVELPVQEEDAKKIATFASQMAIDYALNVIYSCFFESDYSKNYNFKKKNYDFIINNDLLVTSSK